MYNDEFKGIIADEKFAVLQKHAEDFKNYAYKDENIRTPLKTLAASFIFENGLSNLIPNAPQDGGEDAPGMESGHSSGREGGARSNTGEYTPEQLQELRKTNPRKYNKMISRGMIRISSDE